MGCPMLCPAPAMNESINLALTLCCRADNVFLEDLSLLPDLGAAMWPRLASAYISRCLAPLLPSDDSDMAAFDQASARRCQECPYMGRVRLNGSGALLRQELTRALIACAQVWCMSLDASHPSIPIPSKKVEKPLACDVVGAYVMTLCT